MSSDKVVLNRFTKDKKKRNPGLNTKKAAPYFKPALFGCSLGLIFGILLKELFFSPRFTIKNIRIYGTERFVNESDLYQIVSSNAIGKNILSLDLSKLKDLTIRNFLGIKTVSVQRHFPSTLAITIQERTPLAVVYNDFSANYYIVDEDGYVLGMVSEEYEGLPRIHYDTEIKIGAFINKSVVPFYNNLMSMINDTDLKVSSVSFSSKYTKIFLDNGIEIFISQNKDLKASIETVVDILIYETSSGKSVKGIDLRYDKVIVSY